MAPEPRISTGNLAECLSLISEKVGERYTIFLHNAHLFWRMEAILQGIWNLRDVLKRQGSMLIMLMPAGAKLPIELVNDVVMLEDTLPTAKELDEMYTGIMTDAGLPIPEDKDAHIQTLLGVSLFSAENTLGMSVSKQGVSEEDLWKG